jgi:hypothetical protein
MSRKKPKVSFTIPFDPSKVARGHRPHRSGAGKHADKRTKRLRTRGTKDRAAIREW